MVDIHAHVCFHKTVTFSFEVVLHEFKSPVKMFNGNLFSPAEKDFVLDLLCTMFKRISKIFFIFLSTLN